MAPTTSKFPTRPNRIRSMHIQNSSLRLVLQSGPKKSSQLRCPERKVKAALRNERTTLTCPDDMIGFTSDTGPKIWPSVDHINVMSYDLMNRRDTVTHHHTSVIGSEEAIKNYLNIGAPASKINLGFAYYAKFFATAGDCSASPLECPIALAEDSITGKDLLTSGAWTFETHHMAPVDASRLTISYDGTCGPDKGTRCASGCCSQYGNCGTSPEHCSGACQHAFGTGCTDADVAGSWQKAAKNGVTDEQAGAQYYFDSANSLFWTWDTPELISRKFDDIVRKYNLGGVMAWSLGEDSNDWSHVRRMAEELTKTPSKPSSTYASGLPTKEPTSKPEPTTWKTQSTPAPTPTYVSPPASKYPTSDDKNYHTLPSNPAHQPDTNPSQPTSIAAPTPQYDDGTWNPTKYDRREAKVSGTTEQVPNYERIAVPVAAPPSQPAKEDGSQYRQEHQLRRFRKRSQRTKRIARAKA